MRKLVRSIGRLGIGKADSVERQLVKYAGNLCFSLTFLMALSWSVLGALITGSVIYTVISLSVALAYGLCLVTSATGYFNFARRLYLLSLVAHFQAIMLFVGPFQGVEYSAILLLLLPAIMFDRRDRRELVIMTGTAIVAIAVAIGISIEFGPIFSLSLTDLRIGYIVNMIGIVGISFVIVLMLNVNMLRSYLSLNKEREKSAAILRRVLPSSIVRRINAGEVTAPDSHSDAAIMFADIVNFTGLSRSVTPQHLVDFLNELFTDFDHLARADNVEKIKTIGDNYMAATGLLPERSGNLEDLFSMACAMIEGAKVVGLRFGFEIDIRIGIAAGAVISGVIGDLKKSFDVWGDTVNLASHLENTGQPGRIHVSESAYWRLRHRWEFEAREIDTLKGFGRTKTFLYSGRKVGELDNTIDLQARRSDQENLP